MTLPKNSFQQMAYTLGQNLKAFPQIGTCIHHTGKRHLSLGDAHGNFIKVLQFFLQNGIIEMDEQAFDGLVENASSFDDLVNEQNPDSLQKLIEEAEEALLEEKDPEQKQKLEKQIKKDKAKLIIITDLLNLHAKIIINLFKGITLKNKDVHTTLIGDLLADRRYRDDIMLHLLDKLASIGASFDINSSNHDAWLIAFMQRYKHPSDKSKNLGYENAYQNAFFNSQGRSFIELHRFMLAQTDEERAKTSARLRTLMHETYFPRLKLINYDFHENGMIVYMHAGVPFIDGKKRKTIERVVRYFNKTFGYSIDYRDNTPRELAITIEKINLVYRELLTNARPEYTSDVCYHPKGERPVLSLDALCEQAFFATKNELYLDEYGQDKTDENHPANNPVHQIHWIRRNPDYIDSGYKRLNAVHKDHPTLFKFPLWQVHGHDKSPTYEDDYGRSIDNDLGKAPLWDDMVGSSTKHTGFNSPRKTLAPNEIAEIEMTMRYTPKPKGLTQKPLAKPQLQNTQTLATPTIDDPSPFQKQEPKQEPKPIQPQKQRSRLRSLLWGISAGLLAGLAAFSAGLSLLMVASIALFSTILIAGLHRIWLNQSPIPAPSMTPLVADNASVVGFAPSMKRFSADKVDTKNTLRLIETSPSQSHAAKP